jgi:hypothetical protein
MKKLLSILLLSVSLAAVAQDNTEAPAPKKAKFAKNTFNSASIINMQSVEMQKKGFLQFMVAHHFGNMWTKGMSTGENLAQVLGLNSGIAKTYLSFDYSVANYANIGLGMTGNSKFEGWAKFKLLRQQTGAKNIPVSITWYSMANVDAQKDMSDTISANKLVWNKYTYLHQLLIARKFSDKFSLQLMPTFVHYNIVPYGINNSNNVFSLGLGGKYQLSQNKALTFEYFRQLNMYEDVIDKNGNIVNYKPDLLAVGLEFNTGGHVFQFYVGNTTAASNIEQLTKNTNKVGQIALGFRLNRAFYIGKN